MNLTRGRPGDYKRDRNSEGSHEGVVEGGNNNRMTGGAAVRPRKKLVVGTAQGLLRSVQHIVKSNQRILHKRSEFANAREFEHQAGGRSIEQQIHFLRENRDGSGSS